MAGFGWQNGFPFSFGGDPTPAEAAHQALRDAMGGRDGGALGPDDENPDEEWRIAKAIAIGASEAGAEAAIAQASVLTMTHHLEPWQERLGVAGEETDEDTRQALLARLRRRVRADWPSLIAALAEIDPRLTLEPYTRDATAIVQFGLPFGAEDEQGTIFRYVATQWPAFADEYLIRIRFDDAAPPPRPMRTEIARLMLDTLPAWVDWQIRRDPAAGGFVLDVDALDFATVQ